MAPRSLRDRPVRRGYVAPVPGLHGGCRFGFRPAGVEDRYAWADALDSCAGRDLARRAAALLERLLTGWSLTRADGMPVFVTVSNLLDPAVLHPGLFDAILNQVLGFTPPDPDPNPGPPLQPHVEPDPSLN